MSFSASLSSSYPQPYQHITIFLPQHMTIMPLSSSTCFPMSFSASLSPFYLQPYQHMTIFLPQHMTIMLLSSSTCFPHVLLSLPFSLLPSTLSAHDHLSPSTHDHHAAFLLNLLPPCPSQPPFLPLTLNLTSTYPSSSHNT